jgi:hypothetical protein
MESPVSDATEAGGLFGSAKGQKRRSKRKREVTYGQENRTEQKRRHHQDRWGHGIAFIYDQSTQSNDR